MDLEKIRRKGLAVLGEQFVTGRVAPASKFVVFVKSADGRNFRVECAVSVRETASDAEMLAAHLKYLTEM